MTFQAVLLALAECDNTIMRVDLRVVDPAARAPIDQCAAGLTISGRGRPSR